MILSLGLVVFSSFWLRVSSSLKLSFVLHFFEGQTRLDCPSAAVSLWVCRAAPSWVCFFAGKGRQSSKDLAQIYIYNIDMSHEYLNKTNSYIFVFDAGNPAGSQHRSSPNFDCVGLLGCSQTQVILNP